MALNIQGFTNIVSLAAGSRRDLHMCYATEDLQALVLKSVKSANITDGHVRWYQELSESCRGVPGLLPYSRCIKRYEEGEEIPSLYLARPLSHLTLADVLRGSDFGGLAAEIAACLENIVHEMHGRGLFHGHLAWENVLFFRTPAPERLMLAVCDAQFGLAESPLGPPEETELHGRTAKDRADLAALVALVTGRAAPRESRADGPLGAVREIVPWTAGGGAPLFGLLPESPVPVLQDQRLAFKIAAQLGRAFATGKDLGEKAAVVDAASGELVSLLGAEAPVGFKALLASMQEGWKIPACLDEACAALLRKLHEARLCGPDVQIDTKGHYAKTEEIISRYTKLHHLSEEARWAVFGECGAVQDEEEAQACIKNAILAHPELLLTSANAALACVDELVEVCLYTLNTGLARALVGDDTVPPVLRQRVFSLASPAAWSGCRGGEGCGGMAAAVERDCVGCAVRILRENLTLTKKTALEQNIPAGTLAEALETAVRQGKQTLAITIARQLRLADKKDNKVTLDSVWKLLEVENQSNKNTDAPHRIARMLRTFTWLPGLEDLIPTPDSD